MLCTVVLLRKIVYVNTLSVSVTVHTVGRNTEMRVNLNNSIQTINSTRQGKTRQVRADTHEHQE